MIYYVEDDQNIRDLTVYALRRAGFEAEGFSQAQDFFIACQAKIPELILLDIMLPGTDGLEILRRVRNAPALKTLPVMMLTAKSTEYDTVCGLDAGADDYLAKPFGMMELVSRVSALLRRANASKEAVCPSDVLEAGSIVLSLAQHSVSVHGKPAQLTLKEFGLLHALMRNKGCVLTRAQLLEDVWDTSFVGETRTVDAHVQTLRQKLASAHAGADHCVTTIRGVGYCFKENP